MKGAEPGWRKLLRSAELPPGSVAAPAADDADVVLWRSASGLPCAMESRCPHQWSHLATQGAVDGEEIVCLTHMWRFDRDGHGSQESRSGERQCQGDISVYPCAESEGEIWVKLE